MKQSAFQWVYILLHLFVDLLINNVFNGVTKNRNDKEHLFYVLILK